MTRHRPPSRTPRRPRYSPHRGLQALESRVLLDSTLLPITDHRELVVDPSRNQLLIIGSAGTINRYDISSGQLLTPIDLGFTPGGADITPDGQYLYVPHLTPSSTLTLTRVDLTTGATANFTTTVSPNSGLFDCAVLADGRVELTTINDSLPEAFFRFAHSNSSYYYEAALNISDIPVTEPASIFTSADREFAFFIEPQSNGDVGGIRLFQRATSSASQLTSNIPIANPVFAAVSADGSTFAFDTQSGIRLSFPSGTTIAPTLLQGIQGGLTFSSNGILNAVDIATDSIRSFYIPNDSNARIQTAEVPIGEDLTAADLSSSSGQLALSPDESQFFVTTPDGIRIVDQSRRGASAVELTAPASSFLLQNVSLIASVSATSSTTTGNVYFFDVRETDPFHSQMLLGSAPVINGTATFTFAPGASFDGAFHVFARFGGNADLAAAACDPSTIEFFKPTPQLSFTATPPLYRNSVLHLPFSVSCPGMSNFATTASLWLPNAYRPLITNYVLNGSTQFDIVLPAGTYTLRADFDGTIDVASASAYLTISVLPAPTSVSLDPLPDDSYLLQAHINANSYETRTGTLSLVENGSTLMTIDASFPCQFDLSSLSPGIHTFTVVYSGDARFAPSTSDPFIQLVPIATSTALQIYPIAPVVNQPLTLSAFVSPATSGTVTFFDGGTLVGTSPVAQGAASFTFTPTTSGTHTFSASFVPDGNYLHTSASASAYVYASQPTTIDLLALYSNQQLQSAGGVDAIRNLLTAQINDTNTVFANSGLAVSIRLAALVPANYNESGDLNTDWKRLANPADRYMDSVTALRNKFGADLVVLLNANSPVSTSNSTEVVQGVASMLNTNYFNWSNQDQIAFLVVAQDAPQSDYVLAHEIGHTLGIAHAIDDPGSPGITSDARGYRATYNHYTYRDIMAYNPGIIIPCFSNPDLLQSNGIIMGQSGSANAARIIRITAPTLADYRAAAPFGAITAANASSLSGWVLDPKSLAFASTIRIDIDGIPAATLLAGDSSSTLLAQYGNANHAFSYQLPTLAPGRHTVSLYTLDAATGTPVFIASKTVTAHHLAWTLQTPSFIAGQFPTFSLAVKDLANHTVSNYTSTLTLSIYSGPAGGTLTGTLTAPVINGIATFNAFTITKSGTYTLRASDGFLSLNSRRVTVTPDAASAHLVLVSATASEMSLGQYAPPIIFNVQDQFANLVTANRTPISLTLLDSPSASTLSGSATLTLRNGIAKFSNLRPNKPGTYLLSFANPLLPPAEPFQCLLTCLPATTTLPALRPAAYYFAGRTLTLSTALSSIVSRTTYPYTGTLTLTDAAATLLATATLSTSGSAKFLFPTPAPGTYTCYLHYSGDLNHTPASSNSFTLLIKPTV